jgi:hypothetical protein
MGHKNPDKFFNDPFAINPQTGQFGISAARAASGRRHL